MDIVNSIMAFILNCLDSVLPALGLSEEFMTALDNGLTIIIGLLESANYFLPLDILVICLTTMLLVDNFTLIMRIGQWFIRTLRG